MLESDDSLSLTKSGTMQNKDNRKYKGKILTIYIKAEDKKELQLFPVPIFVDLRDGMMRCKIVLTGNY